MLKFLKPVLLLIFVSAALNAQPAHNEQILANTGGTAVAMDRDNAIISDVDNITVHFKDLDYATMLWQDNSSITATVTATGTTPQFGQSVAISNNIAVVGAPSFYGELYAFSGTDHGNKGLVIKMDTADAGWALAPDFPQKISDGASLVSVGTRYIYGAVPTNAGGQHGAFAVFDKETNDWTVKTVPSNGTFGVGMDMAYDGADTIYLIEGTYRTNGNILIHSTKVWQYSISSDSWTELPNNIPEGVDFGASIDFYRTQASDGYLAILSGGNSDNLHTYHLSTGLWTTNTTVSYAVGIGSDAVLSNNHYLYSLVPDTVADRSEFRRIDIQGAVINNTESWISMTPLPLDVGDGTSLAVSAEYIYAIIGDGSTHPPYRYTIADNTWTTLLGGTSLEPGAALTFSNDPEQVYVYTKQSNGSWSNDANISLALPGVQDHFGYSVGVEGDAAGAHIVVGAPKGAMFNGNVYGTVSTYIWDGTAAASVGMGAVLGKFRAFGKSVDIKGDYIIVGAPDGGDDSTDVANSVGAAYTFKLRSDGNYWNPYPDVGNQWIKGTITNEKLGTHVAINSDGNISLLASSLEVTSSSYIYTNDGSTWSESLTTTEREGGAVDTDDDVYLTIQRAGHVHFDINTDGTQRALSFFEPDLVLMTSAQLYKEQAIVNDPQNAGGQARAWDIPCGIKPTYLVANEWAMVSVPCGDGSATIDTLFGDELGTGTGNYCQTDDPAETCKWVMYKDGPNYTGKSRDNVRVLETDAMELGKGYWIIADHDVTLKVDGDSSVPSGVTTRTQLTRSVTSPDVAGYYDFLLPDLVTGEEKKIMVGNSFPRVFKWEYLQILDQPFPASVYHATGYVYDPTQSGQPYRAITANTPGISGEIKPYQGFWIKDLGTHNASNITLGIPFEK